MSEEPELEGLEKVVLSWFGKSAFSMDLGNELDTARSLVDKGYLEWQPAPTWMGMQYSLTEKGRKYRGLSLTQILALDSVLLVLYNIVCWRRRQNAQ